MQYLAVFVCLVAAASAQMFHGGMMGNNMNQFGQMMNQGWNTGWNTGNRGNGNYLQQILQGHMGQQNGQQQQQWGQNYNGGQWNGQTSGRGQQQQQGGMTNNVLGSLLGNLLGSVLMSNMKGNMGGEHHDSGDEMSKMEELMKMSMATEMFDLMRAYNKFKDDEEEFGKAMEHLCFMVNATWAASKQYNFEIFNKTTDQTGEDLEKQGMGKSEAEKMAGAVEILMNEPDFFREMFFRMATWSCWAGHAYLESAIKMDKMQRGEKCEH